MKKLFLLLITLLFAVGVQSVKAKTFTQIGKKLVIVQDITAHVNLDIEQAILNLEKIRTREVSLKGGVITDNLKYPNSNSDAIVNFECHLVILTFYKNNITAFNAQQIIKSSMKLISRPINNDYYQTSNKHYNEYSMLIGIPV